MAAAFLRLVLCTLLGVAAAHVRAHWSKVEWSEQAILGVAYTVMLLLMLHDGKRREASK